MAEFTGTRYITRGIESEIPVELQTVLWDMLEQDKQQGKILDYLQVFTLKSAFENGVVMQEITHTQEQPPHKKNLTLKSDRPIHAKVFVIDDISHVTMLLNHEY